MDEHNTFSTKTEESKTRAVPEKVIWARFYSYIKPYRKNLVVGTISIVGGALVGLVAPYLHMIAINNIITPAAQTGNSSYLAAFEWWIPLFILVTGANYACQYVQTYQMRIVGEYSVQKLKNECVEKLQKISLKYFSGGETGRIMSRPTTDAQQVRIFVRMGLTTIIMDTAQILGSLVIIFVLNWRLALLAVAILPAAVIMLWILGAWSRKQYRRTLTNLAGLVGRMQENSAGMKIIKAFAREDDAASGFKQVNKKTVDSYKRTILISTAYLPVVQMMRIIGTLMILFFGSKMVVSGTISLGLLAAFIEYQFAYFTPLTDLLTAFDQYQSGMSALERIFDLIDTKVEVNDPEPGKALEIGTIKDVRFEHVTFGYDPQALVIEDISFSLEGSKKLALVGPTGAGKSTIINLLERFYDPVGGRILINGCDARDMEMASLRSQISTVLQDSFLFPMSVKDNIRFGKPKASDDQVVEAAKTVGAHEFIMRLPNGYDYVLQEGSSNVSIGQRQLISFARSLLMDPRLLVLDEATASIDPYTELVIQNALKNLLKNRMSIIIAHRLFTIRLCDEILVIEQGKIAEKGTHSQLIAMNGIYSSFYKMQFREEKGVAPLITGKSQSSGAV